MSSPPIAVATPKQILGGSKGVLVVDGYTGYNHVTDPEGRARGGCWAHLRRKVFDARHVDGDDADVGIAKIRGIFHVEHEATGVGIVGTAEHLALREQKSRPRVADFFNWATETSAKMLPKSPLGEALGYAIRQRERLELFLTDARIPIHNNSSERRPQSCHSWPKELSLRWSPARRSQHRRAILARGLLHREWRRAYRVPYPRPPSHLRYCDRRRARCWLPDRPPEHTC